MRERSLVLKAKHLLDGTGSPVMNNVSILIEDGVIKNIQTDGVRLTTDVNVIDLGERTIMPGIIDAHMHFFGVPSNKLETLRQENEMYRVLRASAEARSMLQRGITAARCLGSSLTPHLRRAINDGLVEGPRLVAAGEFISSTNGTWDDNPYVPLQTLKETMIADGPDEVRARVRRRIRDGSTVIKVGLSKGMVGDANHAWGDDPYHVTTTYSLEEVKAITDEAHAHHVMVSAHCIGDAAVTLALDGGVDTIEHGYPITDETRSRLVETGTIVVSTISQLYFHKISFEDYHYSQTERDIYLRHMDAMESTFRKNIEAGVQYALGTDLVGYPTHPQDRAAMEFQLAVSWGMDPMAAIVAGTRNSARALGMDDRIGTIEIGKCADIIAVSGDPLHDISILNDVSFVMLDGKMIKNVR